jgi:hypothetical protein
MCHSEFEELEAVPTSSAIDGPLEPPPSSSAISDTLDESFANYFSVCSPNFLLLRSNLFFRTFLQIVHVCSSLVLVSENLMASVMVC